MWRVVVRLTCIVMGGVLVVMTLGIGVRRDDTLARLLLLQRPRFQDGFLVVYHPESNQQWLLDDYSTDHYFGRDASGYYSFTRPDGYLYRKNLFDDESHRISSHPVDYFFTWSLDRKWILYATSFYKYSDLYMLQTDGSIEYLLSDTLPNNLFAGTEYPILSNDGKWVVFAAHDLFHTKTVIFRVRSDGTELKGIRSLQGERVSLNQWISEEQGIIVSDIGMNPAALNLETGNLRPIVSGNNQGIYGCWSCWSTSHQIFIVDDVQSDYIVGVRENGSIAWRRWARDQYFFDSQNQPIIIANGHNGYLRIIAPSTGVLQAITTPFARLEYRYVWSSDKKWVVFSARNEEIPQSELWRLDATSRQFVRLWWASGSRIFDVWLSPDGQEILVDAATPTWAGLLRMNPDGSDVRELTSVQDIELGEHDFVDWATLPDRAWQPVVLGGGGIGLLVVGLGWPIIRKLVLRRRHLA